MKSSSRTFVRALLITALASFAGAAQFASAQSLAQEVPNKFVYQGRATHANGTAVEDASVTFTLQVRSPDGACLLFEESHVRNMNNTNGVFSLFVGAGTNTGASALSLKQAFNNNTDKVGASSCAYHPVAGDGRKMRFTYDTGSEVVTLPVDQQILSVPYAMNSNYLQGLSASDFLKTSSPNSTQINLDLVLNNTTEIIALANGTSTRYAPAASFPTTGLTQGQVLTWDVALNKWIGVSQAALVEGGVPVLSSPGKVSGNAIITGTIGGNTIINTTGAITSSSVSTTNISSQSLNLFESTNTKKISINAPANLSANYAITLPASAGSNGQLLIGDGTGRMSWHSLVMSDLKSSVSGSNLFANPSCAANETLSWSSTTDQFSCGSIGSLSASAITSGTLASARGGTGQTSYAPGEILIGNSAGGLSKATLTAGTGFSIVNGNGTITLSKSGFSNISDLRGVANAQQFPTNCSAAQTMVYQSLSDTFVCATISAASLGGVNLSSVAPTNNQVLKFNSTTNIWEASNDANSGGTVTSVTAGTGLVAGTITSAGTLNVDTGTTANKIVQLTSAGKLPAVDGSQLTNLPVPAQFAPFSNMQTYDSTQTFTVPANVTRVFVQAWGAGGGGGGGGNILSVLSGGSGGGGGSFAAGFVTVIPGSQISVTVGAAGALGLVGGNGTAGGFSGFGSSINAGGGAGGAAAQQASAVGGTATVGGLLVEGGRGAPASLLLGGAGGNGANGGGQGGPSALINLSNGYDGTAPGGAGSGGTSVGKGGNGAQGRVIVWY